MSDLLNQASLVMVPSGYKEDTVYSVVPSDGSGDLQLTRASNGTRINSAGLVEVCPWNLATDSENFSAVYSGINASISNDTTSAPNGTTTADSLLETTATDIHAIYADYTQSSGVQYTYSVYVKSISGRNVRVSGSSGFAGPIALVDLSNGSLLSGSTGASVESVGNGWYRISLTATTTTTTVRVIIYSMNGTAITFAGSTSNGVYVWGAQLNIGSTAKPYFPTTDRLNVPRLTYQNGGGGCPSLLLEKQSTNLVKYSQDISNTSGSSWGDGSSGGTATLTANYATSPDGTSNATRVQLNQGSGYALWQQILSVTSGASYTYSIWLKSLSGTPTIVWLYDGAANRNITLTSEWVRYTFSYTASSTNTFPRFAVWSSTWGTSSTADILAWGAQLEASSYPTSYIPTTSSSATRVADACFKTGISSLIGQSEGFIAGEVEGLTNSYGSQSTIMSVSDGTTQNRVMFSFNTTTGYVTPRIFKAGSTIFVNDFAITLTQKIKFAIGWGGGRAVCYVNGTQVQETTGLTFFSSGTLTRLGADDGAGSNIGIGKVGEYILGTTNLTNAQLQSLTL